MADTEGGDLPPLRKALEERKRQRDSAPEAEVQGGVSARASESAAAVAKDGQARPAVSEHKARAQSAVAAVEAWGDVDAGADYSNAGAMDGVFETAALEAEAEDGSTAADGAAAFKAAQAARQGGAGRQPKVAERGQGGSHGGHGGHAKDRQAGGRERFEVMEQARARQEKAAQGAARAAVDARGGQGQGQGQGEQEQTYGQRVREQEAKKARDEAAREKAARSDQTKAAAGKPARPQERGTRPSRVKKREWALPSGVLSGVLSPHGALFLMAAAVCFLTTPWLAAVFVPFAVSFANGTWDEGWGVLPFPSAVFAVSAALWFFA